ncbi:hypothetical protein DSM104299_04162 [Baekduia alba]|uniref:hypothetical protein n=1 Tax=Baekduia alba TaxID=2997333 RepID=UPI0023401B9F|nr:hypothetical protein [Baekduia alba]WCB95419.1 hypothetical protein DSM104299_04162 [Baekduia alba]
MDNSDRIESRDSLAASSNDDNISLVLMIEAGLRGLLRAQTLPNLDFNHGSFDEARDLAPSDLLAAASISEMPSRSWTPSVVLARLDPMAGSAWG